MTLANLGFEPKQSMQAALSAGQVMCADLSTPVGPGPHTLTIDITVNGFGYADSFRCTVDGVSGAAGTSIAPGATDFDIALGTSNAPSPTTLAIDNVVVYVQP